MSILKSVPSRRGRDGVAQIDVTLSEEDAFYLCADAHCCLPGRFFQTSICARRQALAGLKTNLSKQLTRVIEGIDQAIVMEGLETVHPIFKTHIRCGHVSLIFQIRTFHPCQTLDGFPVHSETPISFEHRIVHCIYQFPIAKAIKMIVPTIERNGKSYHL